MWPLSALTWLYYFQKLLFRSIKVTNKLFGLLQKSLGRPINSSIESFEGKCTFQDDIFVPQIY